MSLPTPPGTSHRDEKENRAPRFARVSWCETTEYHAITSSPPHTLSAQASAASKAGPSKSILKRPAYPTTPVADENVKEGTPEPSDPLADLHYLDGPVSRILAEDASLRELIEAYSVLTARLRTCVTDNTDADASWPLFQPLRKHRDLLVEVIVRDIRQVFVDPLNGIPPPMDPLETPKYNNLRPRKSKIPTTHRPRMGPTPKEPPANRMGEPQTHTLDEKFCEKKPLLSTMVRK